MNPSARSAIPSIDDDFHRRRRARSIVSRVCRRERSSAKVFAAAGVENAVAQGGLPV